MIIMIITFLPKVILLNTPSIDYGWEFPWLNYYLTRTSISLPKLNHYLTQNVYQSEAVVKSHADEKPTDCKLPEAGRERSECAKDEAHQIGTHESWDAAKVVRYPTKYKAAHYGSKEESDLRWGSECALITDPVKLKLKGKWRNLVWEWKILPPVLGLLFPWLNIPSWQ